MKSLSEDTSWSIPGIMTASLLHTVQPFSRIIHPATLETHNDEISGR